MKSILIILLLIALSAAAFFTRPSQGDFNTFVKSQIPDKPRGFWDKVLQKKPEPDRFLDGCTFKDRFVYVQVEKDGHLIYTGAFDHWFAHGTPIPKAERTNDEDQKPPPDAKRIITQTE